MDCRLDKSADLLQVSTPITPDELIQIKLTLGSQLIAEIACLVIGVNNSILIKRKYPIIPLSSLSLTPVLAVS
jgi:hypothetical protein